MAFFDSAGSMAWRGAFGRAPAARFAGVALVAFVWFGCEERASPRSSLAPASAPEPARSIASSAGSAATRRSAADAAGSTSVLEALEHAPLRSIRRETDGRLTAELEANVKVAVSVVLATRARPRAHRAPAAYQRIAAHIAPGLVPDATLRGIPLGELAKAAEDVKTARYLQEVARVLSDGRVRAHLSIVPKRGAARIDLADLREGSRAFGWESALVRREPPKQAERVLLASYQALLVVDYLTGNLARKSVELAGERLLADADNDVFSQHGVDGAVGDALPRLMRHMTFSRGLLERLSALERVSLERALRGPPDEGLLVTPKELDGIIERRDGIEKLISELIARRGRDKALILP